MRKGIEGKWTERSILGLEVYVTMLEVMLIRYK